MRARLQKFLPIFLLALLVQVLAPIGASWAAAFAVADPLAAVEICHNSGAATDQGSDQNGAHADACSICCLAAVSVSLDAPVCVAFVAPYRELARVAWSDQAPDRTTLRVGSNAQARAPPVAS